MTYQSTCLPLKLMISLGSLYISNLKITCHQLKLINLKIDIHYLFYLSLCLVSNSEITTKIRNLQIVWFALLFHKFHFLWTLISLFLFHNCCCILLFCFFGLLLLCFRQWQHWWVTIFVCFDALMFYMIPT